MTGRSFPSISRALKGRSIRGHALRRGSGPGLNLTLLLSEDELDGGFVAEVMGLPGCMSQGETQEEAVRNTLEAYHEILEDGLLAALEHRPLSGETRVELNAI